MDAQVTKNQIEELSKDGADIRTMVFDFGETKIKRCTKGEISLLKVTGIYGPKLAKEIEKIAAQCRGNVGVEFHDMKQNPKSGRRFDPSIMGVLKRIQDRCGKRRKLFFLLSPPSDLTDLLKLTGASKKYRVVDRAEDLAEADLGSATEPAARPNTKVKNDSVKKRIKFLNQSLERMGALEKGLDSAEKRVKRFLPQEPPTTPGYEFSFTYLSSEKVGGDFFDFIPLDEEHLGVSIGDVSGHGIDAAILMGICKKVVHIRAKDAGVASPRLVLEKANTDLVGDFSSSSFVTVLYGILHIPTGEFVYCRAGHEPPFVCGPKAGDVKVYDTGGIPLGIDRGNLFKRTIKEKTIRIDPGGFMLLSTDGLAECWSPRNVKFSRPRLMFTLEKLDERFSSQDALAHLLKAVHDFSDGRPQEDDMTIVFLKRLLDSGKNAKAK